MKTLGITSTAILTLLLASTAPAYGQGQEDKRDHPQQRQAKHEQAPKQEQHAQPSRPDQPQQQQAQRQQKVQSQQSQQQQHAQQQQQANRTRQAQQHPRPQPVHHQPAQRQSQQRVQQAAWQQHRATNWQSDHRNWQQRGGYQGYRIPDYQYRGYFGPDHGFRIQGLPFLVVGGYPRFQYNGYWVSPVDPWPQEWASNWYDTDDVYINYVDNGYYLYNRRYPSEGIAVNILIR